MKIAIIIPNVIESVPYIKNYIDVFDRMEVNYEIICWDRNQIYTALTNTDRMHLYNYSGPESNSMVQKNYDYWLFSRFVVKCLKSNNYDFLTVHTIVMGCFLGNYLKKEFKSRYIFDIRDYSPMYPFVKKKVANLIRNSIFTTISSEGFKKWLPKYSNYVMGHNVRKRVIENALMLSCGNEIKRDSNKINVLTIGQIRDFTSNSRLIESLGNKDNIRMTFAGSGLATEKLKNFSKMKFFNVLFSGRYNKDDEGDIVKESDFINVILPISVLSNTLTSNRFYLSLVHKKPLIVNSESFQAELVLKYNLGFVVDSTDDIHIKLLEYIERFDKVKFENGCFKILNVIFHDIQKFEDKITFHFS
ncbi:MULTISPECIES: glycosyltransferase family 4 protein [unclassified Polaribacter]|uniref:glycosyltransferase family 4 protein n=1 Tax=unclassified Polaribacter TaxID=196858 RepID=UPI0011BF631F|nr:MULTISPECIES: glycosyltransferase family 4 protein [unclassified Polaribacter]TXD50335.1 glycosyltransferase family 4 protein [Polaribacter sp. IC063]TXD57180.1 glycosyltransferase family 4 protein [Polaribacter sp. IC066]